MSICKVKDDEYQQNYRNKDMGKAQSCKSDKEEESDFSYQLYSRLMQLGQVTDFASSALKGLTPKFCKNSFFLEVVNLLPLYGYAVKVQYLQAVFETKFFFYSVYSTLTLQTPVFERTVSRSWVIFLFFYRQKCTPVIFPGA